MTEYRKTIPPAMKMYQLRRFSFGKATSFAPIIKGIRKFPNHRRYRRRQKEEDHHQAMQSEHPVVRGRFDERALRFDQVQAHESCCRAADEEKESNRSEVQPGDPFVIRGEKPGFPSVPGVEIMDPRQNADFLHCLTHGFATFRPSASDFASDLM